MDDNLTMTELLQVVKDLQEARQNKNLVGNVELKIGEMKICDDCHKIKDVVAYNGICDYDTNWGVECECSTRDKDVEWWKPCKENDDCDFHKDLDVEEIQKEQDDYKKRDKTVEAIFLNAPPKNDSILELDRIAYMFGHLYNCSTNDSRAFVFDNVMRYCAKNGLITK